MKSTSLLCLLAFWTAPLLAQENAGWIDLLSKTDVSQPVAGTWTKSGNTLKASAANGARIVLNWQPTAEYDYEVSFTRHNGRDSIALIFVHGGRQACYEVDAWGQRLAGIQNINNQDVRQNPTRLTDQALQNGRKYTMRIAVRKEGLTAYLDDKQLVEYKTSGGDLSVVEPWRIPDQKSLGLGVWNSETTFHSIRVKPVGNAPQVASTAPATPPRTTTTPRTTPAPQPMPATPNANPPANGQRVLIVIANQDFFYREYGDPRAELERAGFVVEVAAGRKAPCRPHTNSGQGNDGGIVNPDFALADVDPDRYVAILFSGGWGSSMYQFAFQGSYDNATYNGDQATKRRVNELINAFVTQDKYVCGVCHGVSVLAWARVDNRSLLNGKQATGPPLQGPAGIYNGRRAQPPSRWNEEVNGARMVRANSIGNPANSTEDVVVDGKIITGQDDWSAAALGRILAERLRSN